MQTMLEQVQAIEPSTELRADRNESERETQRELTALELSLVGGGQGVMVFL